MTTPSSSPEKHWRRALTLAITALLCGVLLSGLSAWFLGSVAIVGLAANAYTFNIHVPGALVRLFAIGRTVAKYGERLVGHKAALQDQVERRADLFRRMANAPSVLRSGWQLGHGDRLADYLDDVDDIDFARLRINLPFVSLAAGLAIGFLATAVVAPLALLVAAPAFAAVAILSRAVGASARRALVATREAQRQGAGRLGSALAAVVGLKAEQQFASELAASAEAFDRATARTAGMRRQIALLEAVAGLVGPVVSFATILIAWRQGDAGQGLLAAVFVGFGWLALGEPIQGVARMLVARLRRDLAAPNLAQWPTAPAATPPTVLTLQALEIDALQRLAPDGRRIGKPVTLSLQAGRPLALVGPSGSGKTSLLKQIAGWIGDDDFRSGPADVTPAQRRAASLFCAHDAAVLADTVRANLFAPEQADEALWQALEAVELRERMMQAGGLDGWLTQETLSLGEAQRMNLARAFLARESLVLLDEPSEHLDAGQGARIMGRLLADLDDRMVVFSTHAGAVQDTANTLQLDA